MDNLKVWGQSPSPHAGRGADVWFLEAPLPTAGKGAKRRFNASSVKVEVMVGCREKTLCVKFIYDWR